MTKIARGSMHVTKDEDGAIPEPDKSSLPPVLVLRDFAPRLFYENGDGAVELVKRADRGDSADFWQEYARGAAGIILKLDPATFGNRKDRHDVGTSNENISRHFDKGCSIFMERFKRRMASRAQDWPNEAMLVSVIQVADSDEHFAATAFKGLNGSKIIFNPLAWGIYSSARPFIVVPVGSADELQVLVKRSMVGLDQLPHQVVHGTPQVVNSVAYYDRERFRGSLNESNLDFWLSSHLVVLDGESVRLALYEGFELPFKIRDMVLCSIELHDGAVKHDEEP